MCKFLKEEEIRILATRTELQEALDFYECHDKWIRVKANEVKAFGATNFPLFLSEIKEKVTTCSDECFDACIEDAGIFLTIPIADEQTYRTYATRYTSLQSVYERSGTNCRMVRTIHSTKTQKALSAEQRGELIQLGYSTSSEEVLFYISDEMISYNGSKLYVVLPYKKGIAAVEEMATELGDLIYKTGCISHEALFVQWYVKNGDTESHAQFLKNKGFLSAIEEVRYILSFSSSNIGNSKMSARLFCEWQGHLIPIGKPQSVWHLATKAVEDNHYLQEENGASIEDFRKKLRWLGASLKENEDCIETMGNTIIRHPHACFAHILKQYCPTLPSKLKAEALEHVTFPTQTTAIDLYLEIVALTEKLDVKQFHRWIQITEEIAQLQYINFQKFDREM